MDIRALEATWAIVDQMKKPATTLIKHRLAAVPAHLLWQWTG